MSSLCESMEELIEGLTGHLLSESAELNSSDQHSTFAHLADRFAFGDSKKRNRTVNLRVFAGFEVSNPTKLT